MNVRKSLSLMLSLLLALSLVPVSAFADETVELVPAEENEIAEELVLQEEQPLEEEPEVLSEEPAEEPAEELQEPEEELTPLAVYSGSCGANANWELREDGVLLITGTGRMNDYDNTSKVPWRQSGYPAVTTAIIGKGITYIGDNCFRYNKDLTSIELYDTVESFAKYCFNGCTKLNHVTINLTSFEQWFSVCENYYSIDSYLTSYSPKIEFFLTGLPLAEVALPSNVTEVPKSAFRSGSNIESVVLHSGVTSIGENAFSQMPNLESVRILGPVQELKAGTFSSCPKLARVVLPETLETIDENSFTSCTSLTDINLPEGLTTIGQYAFNNCSSLESAVIPSTVTSLGKYMFYKCTSLRSIDVKSTSGQIPESFCEGCTSLETIRLAEGLTSIEKNAFNRASKNLGELTIPSTVTSIKDSAFYGTAWKKITIYDTLTDVHYSAFGDNGILIDYEKDDSINGELNVILSSADNWMTFCQKTIPPHDNCKLFVGGKMLTTYHVPEGTTEIPEMCFYNMQGLTSVVLPRSVTTLNNRSFWNDENAGIDVVYEGTACEWEKILESYGSYAQYSLRCRSLSFAKDHTFQVKEEGGSIRKVCTTCGYQDPMVFKTNGSSAALTSYTGILGRLEIPSKIGNYTVTTVGDRSNKCVYNVSEVVLPSTVTTIDHHAFEGSNIRKINIPSSVTKIGSEAFDSCRLLLELHIPSSVTELGDKCYGYYDVYEPIGEQIAYVQAGSKALQYCKDNDVKYVVEAAVHEHKPVTVKGTPATCTKEGTSDYTKCSICDEVMTAATIIPALGHDTGSVGKENVVRNREQGLISYDLVTRCSRCKQVMKSVHQEEPYTAELLGLKAKLAVPTTLTAAKGQKIVWSSSNTSVAAVSSGKVTGKAQGSVTITAKLVDSKGNILKTEEFDYEIVPAISGMKLSTTKAAVGAGYEFPEITVNLTDKAGNAEYDLFCEYDGPDFTVEWTGPTTFVVMGNRVTTKAVTVLIKDCISQKTAKLSVTVGNPTNTVTTSMKGGTKQNVVLNKTLTLKAAGARKDGLKPISTAVTWSSSNESVAKVDAKGKVTGLKPGTCTITAAASAGEGELNFTVTVWPALKSFTLLDANNVKAAKVEASVGDRLELSQFVKVDSFVWDKGVEPGDYNDIQITYVSTVKPSIATVDVDGGSLKCFGTGTVKVNVNVVAGNAKKKATISVVIK